MPKDIEHKNTGRRALEFAHKVVYGHPVFVLCFFFLAYGMSILIFALIYSAFPAHCFRLDGGDFGIESMMWMSIHVFSTIGFGNLAPRQSCTGAQLVVLLESFASLLVVSATGGYVVKMFMRPLSAVRFSSIVLVNAGRRRMDEADGSDTESMPSTATTTPQCTTRTSAGSGSVRRPSTAGSARRPSLAARSTPPPAPPPAPMGYRRRLSHTADQNATKATYITFRMVRQGSVQLRDVHVRVQAQYWVAGATAFGDRDSHKGRVVDMKLEQSYFTTLEQLQVWHRLDESSPLWRMRDSLQLHLDGLEVSVSAFDTASLQKVMFFHRYDKSDLRVNCVFETMLSEKPRQRYAHGLLVYEADHSKLDSVHSVQPDYGRQQMARQLHTDGQVAFDGQAAACGMGPLPGGLAQPGGFVQPGGIVAQPGGTVQPASTVQTLSLADLAQLSVSGEYKDLNSQMAAAHCANYAAPSRPDNPKPGPDPDTSRDHAAPSCPAPRPAGTELKEGRRPSVFGKDITVKGWRRPSFCGKDERRRSVDQGSGLAQFLSTGERRPSVSRMSRFESFECRRTSNVSLPERNSDTSEWGEVADFGKLPRSEPRPIACMCRPARLTPTPNPDPDPDPTPFTTGRRDSSISMAALSEWLWETPVGQNLRRLSSAAVFEPFNEGGRRGQSTSAVRAPRPTVGHDIESPALQC